MVMTIHSSAFESGERIPCQYTGEGQDLSPPLRWEGVPQVTREFALICDDPDAPCSEPWVHWLIYNLPSDTQSLPEGIPRHGQIERPICAKQGRNSWPQGENLGYLGPMPPRRHGLHHYHFRLYALDTPLNLAPGLDKAQLLEAISEHVLATAELTGTYERQ
ncbi:MAG: YbhB/YbcL family Raf kinase inhibitor-like protein [Planctomycetes bacterium]|nr:YbhB/YbcL family Raf kinase inhibitor-like protein [Planctomycetota bacterium]